MTTILSISNAWGSQHGGVDTLNYGICRGLARIKGVKVICLVPYLEKSSIRNGGVHVIGLYDNVEDGYRSGWLAQLEKRLKKHQLSLNSFAWVIGHDVFTGYRCLEIKKEYPHVRTLVTSTQVFEAYEYYKDGDGEKAREKHNLQIDVYRDADLVACIGPYIFDAFAASSQLYKLVEEKRIINFIPYLPKLPVSKQSSKSLRVFTMGRLDERAAKIKGLDFVVGALAKAWKDATTELGTQPTLTVYGLDKDEMTYSRQSKKLIETVHTGANSFIAVIPMRYTDNTAKLQADLRDHSVFIMPSVHEGFGLTGWEAIAQGIPVIISRNSGLYLFLESEKVENLVTVVDILPDTEATVEQLSRRIREVACNMEAKRKDALTLIKRLGKEYSASAVSKRLLDTMAKVAGMPAQVPVSDDEHIVPATPGTTATQGVGTATTQPVPAAKYVVKYFYEALNHKDFLNAWNCLSPDFRRRAWKDDYELFKGGYYNFRAAKNICMFNPQNVSHTLVDMYLYYEDQLEVSFIPHTDNLSAFTLAQFEDFTTRVQKVIEILRREGIDPNMIEIRHLFNPGFSEYVIYKGKQNPVTFQEKFPPTATTTINRLMKVACVAADGQWKIDRIYANKTFSLK
jgi:glycosyltransferase involved in cell wall biosynthesis